jgi:hypothetical protein
VSHFDPCRKHVIETRPPDQHADCDHRARAPHNPSLQSGLAMRTAALARRAPGIGHEQRKGDGNTAVNAASVTVLRVSSK